jgi:hypothetical protein
MLVLGRGFDAVGVHGAVVVHLPSLTSQPSLTPLTSPTAAEGGTEAGPYVGDAAMHQAWQADVPWLAAGLKALALAVALGAAYLAGLFLLGSHTRVDSQPAPAPVLSITEGIRR